MVLRGPREPLVEATALVPSPGPGQVLVRVHACGVCRTDLHVVDGELADPKLPLVPGHQIVGTVEAVGPAAPGGTGNSVGISPEDFAGTGAEGAGELRPGDRVGIPWLGWTCGECRYCRSGAENLCDRALFTGYTLDGGYAEAVVADARFCFPIPEGYPDLQAAPLLCAGLIGFRCLRMAGDPAAGVERLGIFGFGAAAHVLTQVARHRGQRVFAFTRGGDEAAQRFALDLGAEWAGATGDSPPEEIDAAIVFAPAGELVPAALRAVRKGGTVVCGGIHMSDIPSFPYEILWGERVVRSVANLTRADAAEFLRVAPEVPVRTEVEMFALAEANDALDRIRAGRIRGAAVLQIA
jgi:propanol-preferring alcohol dehydrogenase